MSVPRIAFTIGDVNGIGIEVLVRALGHAEIRSLCRPLIVGNTRLIDEGINALPQDRIVGHVANGMLVIGEMQYPIFEIRSDASLMPGTADPLAGKLAGDAITQAVTLALRSQVDAIVTMPVSKLSLNLGGYPFPGHTEMLAELSGGSDPLMILMTDGLRVALATIHTPLAEVPALITEDRIQRRLTAFYDTLKMDFGIAEPRIVVLGINPHAGEGGYIGREELDIINPVIARAQEQGMNVDGALPADGFFARYRRDDCDGVLAMYHDQGLIPLKMFAGGGGVNVTSGLPIVRTSPDHGTAYGIAGQGVADERSVIEAVRIAVDIVTQRKQSE